MSIMCSMFLGSFLLISSALAADIQFEGRIDISEFDAKYVRSSWCIFSDGSSSTAANGISTSLSGENAEQTDTFSHRGTTYLRRKIGWNSKETSSSFSLNFAADSAAFSNHEQYDKGRCSYRTWDGQSTSAENKLKAKAAFIVPNNVWAIRIRSVEKSVGGVTQIDLFNDDYVVDEKGQSSLQKVGFAKFDGSMDGQYFLVNPSADGLENFVYLDLEYNSNMLAANNLNLEFKVDFISANECLSDLKGLSYTDLLNRNIQDNKIESALVNMACMMNENYIKHSLATMHLSKLDDFFVKLNDVEKRIQSMINDKSKAKDLKSLDVLLSLIDKVRFYYSYEILKESVGLLSQKIDFKGVKIDSLYYIEILRRRGVSYLFNMLDNFSSSLKTLKAKQTGPFIQLDNDSSIKFDIFMKTLLPMEFAGFSSANKLIYKPQFLALYSYESLELVVARVEKSFEELKGSSEEILSQDSLTIPQTDLLIEKIRNLSNELRLYVMTFEQFKGQADTGDSVKDIIDARRLYLTQIETIFNIDLKVVAGGVKEYYLRHFEDPAFKNIKVGDKKYKDVREFINDFEKIIAEVQ
jgi:hypothetical protein